MDEGVPVITQEQEAIALHVIQQMLEWPDEQRVEFLAEIGAKFCPDCGRIQPEGRRCQCWNDE